ncbi:MAG: hypothetical protein IJZ79_07155 [Bacilli bacterium]|nr:hypothetical protein [Bacilli bacterium]
MKSKLNNKGYMLIEIILASALAFGLAYFIIDLTIKLKNKNDDLMITTLMSTDQAIISNKLMEYIKSENDNFDCGKITIGGDNKTLSYNGKLITKINDYGKIDNKICQKDVSTKSIKINILISGPDILDKDFNVIIYYEF